MSDQRQDDETIGRALGRAVESQAVRETPFERSRIARRVDRPPGRGWTYALPVAAALALFVAMGAFFAGRGPQGVTTPDASATPSVSATSGPRRTESPAPSATVAPAGSALVYFARDGLPPVGATVSAAAPFRTLPAAERISARVRALWDARAPSADLGNVFRPHRGGTSLANVTTTISGDTATVVIDAGSWDSLSSTEGIALIQQLVYTITEESGIRRAAVREPGKDHAIIGNGILKDGLGREDVFGYRVKGGDISAGDGELAADVVDWRASVDDVAPGLGRFVVELKPAGQVPQGFVPRFTAKLEQGRNANEQEPGKYVLRLELPDAYWPLTPGEAFHGPLKVIGKTPIRQLSAYPLGGGGGRPGVAFAVELDDARPWRVTVMQSPLRVVVDIGGAPDAVSESVAVYAPRPGATVDRTFTVSGLARAFEANVNWRLRDSSGRVVATGFTTASIGTSAAWGTFEATVTVPTSVSGNVKLEVFWGSPRDGSDVGLVGIPLRIR